MYFLVTGVLYVKINACFVISVNIVFTLTKLFSTRIKTAVAFYFLLIKTTLFAEIKMVLKCCMKLNKRYKKRNKL